MDLVEKIKQKLYREKYSGIKHAVLAYSGGLDTSVILKLLQETLDISVTTVTFNLGQDEDFGEIEKKAKALGAKNHYTIDVVDEFVKGYCFLSLKFNGLYEGSYPISTALARYLKAKHLVEIAKREGADAIAHGCTGKGNDQIRFDVSIKSLAPEMRILAPVREWGLWRDEEISYAKEKGIPVSTVQKKYSVDQNIWGRSVEAGPVEHPEQEVPDDALEWITKPEDAPDEPAILTVEFKEGIPIALYDGKKSKLIANDPLEIVKNLNRIAGKNGVGIIDHMEDRVVGLKSREFYECPAAVALIVAHRDMEKFVMTKDELEFKHTVDQKWVDLAYSGKWYNPLKKALDSFVETNQKKVTGEVYLKLFKGNILVIGRKSPFALYDLGLATYDKTTTWDQADAIGFIKLYGIQTIMSNQLNPN